MTSSRICGFTRPVLPRDVKAGTGRWLMAVVGQLASGPPTRYHVALHLARA